MDDELKEKVEQALKAFDMPSFDKYKPNVQEYLLKIEEEILRLNESRKESIRIYKKNKLNIDSLVKKIGIARQTIYNNGIQDYIQNRQEELAKEDLFNILIGKDNKITELQEIIKKLEYRDLKEQLYLDKIEYLETENKNLLNQINSINIENIINLKKLTKLQNEYDNIIERGKILKFDDNK